MAKRNGKASRPAARTAFQPPGETRFEHWQGSALPDQHDIARHRANFQDETDNAALSWAMAEAEPNAEIAEIAEILDCSRSDA